VYAATVNDIRMAAKRIEGKAHLTPVMTCGAIDRLAGRRLFFKCEHLQKVGAFKFRGASNAVFSLGDLEASRGVLTHSSGNHAQALALAARMRGVPAHIVMPTSASPVKRRAVEEYGGRVVPCEPTLIARETTAAVVQEETGAVFIHPYDDPRIIAGQGTAALELLSQVDGLDAIIAPVGGGGLLSGTCIAARGIDPRIRLFAAEPQGADDAARSLAAGRLIPQTAPDTVADGLLTSLGELTWPIIRDHVEQVVTVSDEAIIAAMRLAWERAKLLVETSAAVAIILSGGNVELERLPWKISGCGRDK